MLAEFKSGEYTYRCGKIDAFKQSHIVRRLTPVGGAVMSAWKKLKVSPVEAFTEIMGAIARLSDEDVEYVQKACLKVVQRKQGETWVAVYVDGGLLQFEDIGMLELNEITFQVLKANLSGFFAGLAQRGWAGPDAGQTSPTSPMEKTS